MLIPEPAGKGGACVTARKGVGRFGMRVEGRGAHSGGAFQDGASAVVELAQQIVGIHGMVDLDRGITLNAAPVWGGSRPNVISPDAGCEIDLRVNSIPDGEHMERMLLETTALTPGCRVMVQGGMNRPPYAEGSGIFALYDKARGVAETVGIALPRQHRGGGRTAISPRRWASRRWMVWAAPVPARMPSRAHTVAATGAAGGADGGVAGEAGVACRGHLRDRDCRVASLLAMTGA